MPESKSTAPLVWIDCEMTGLDAEADTILSVACFVTNYYLDIIEPHGYSAIVRHDKDSLDRMGEWCTKQHSASGLTAAALASPLSAVEVSSQLLDYIKTHVPEPRTALLAGNTVHQDKAFLMKPPWTPVVDWLHYRILDVSAIKEAARRWSPKEVLDRVPPKQMAHEAKADVLESIEEARYWQTALFQRRQY